MFTYNNRKTAVHEAAAVACESLGQTLAKVKDENDWNALLSYEDINSEYGYWWLGAEKKNDADKYIWNDGARYSESNSDMKVLRDAPGNRCLALYTVRSKQAKIYSMPCNRHLYYICESRVLKSAQKAEINDVSPTIYGNFSTGEFTSSASRSVSSSISTATPSSIPYTSSSSTSTSLYTAIESTTTSMAAKTQGTMDFDGITTDKVFSPTTETQLDPVVWLYVSLTLALLLVVAVVVIAKLWTDVRKLRNRVMSSTANMTNGRYNTTKPEAQDTKPIQYYPPREEETSFMTLTEEK